MGTLFYIMGVSGSGKTTVGKALAQQLAISFYDGDDFHPKANIEKMADGIPLEDADRWGWLAAIRNFAEAKIKKGHSLVIACSALKEQYRVILQKQLPTAQVKWVYLEGTYEMIWERIQTRTDHFMPASLLQSQFDTLEAPTYGVRVSIADPVEKMVPQILEGLSKKRKPHLSQRNDEA